MFEIHGRKKSCSFVPSTLMHAFSYSVSVCKAKSQQLTHFTAQKEHVYVNFSSYFFFFQNSWQKIQDTEKKFISVFRESG